MTSGVPTIHVVAAVIVREGRVLACRRNRDRADGGLWEFPGGKVEPGERPVDALVREIHEELGVTIAIIERVHRATTDVLAVRIDLDTYMVRLTAEAPTNSTDHDELRWLRPDELSSIEWCSPDQPIVELIGGRDVLLADDAAQ